MMESSAARPPRIALGNLARAALLQRHKKRSLGTGARPSADPHHTRRRLAISADIRPPVAAGTR
ncbi:hypothetical protein B0H10DRAFT_1976033 [Mycena sp. CBHHK59/15]|nr:hypothetical protein B0H10DRAFT_1976033 [Mycena sp. CBHHK59/15]